MKDVLDEIIAHKRLEVERMKQLLSPHKLYTQVETMIEDSPLTSMRSALMNAEVGIIAEFKRKSPSKGWIRQDGKAEEIPLAYQANDATAVSILTDEAYFGGTDEFISLARKSGVTIPILYKNFVIDEYQLFQARLCGASAVLLIASDLSMSECKSLIRTSHELGLEVLLEMHAEAELSYADLEPDMYGINNRNLGTFVTDVQNSFKLISKLPADGCKISESGIDNASVVAQLMNAGFNGFLIGEGFMRANELGKAVKEFINEVINYKNILS